MTATKTIAAGALLLCLLGPGCRGWIADPGGEGEPPDSPGGPPSAGPMVDERGTGPLRRLNARELDNTLGDLLGQPVLAATASIPADVPGRTELDNPSAWLYDRVGTRQSVSHLHVDAYLKMAGAIAEEASRNDALSARLMPGCDLSALGPRIRPTTSRTKGSALQLPARPWLVCHAGDARCGDVTDPDEVKFQFVDASVSLQYDARTAGDYRIEIEAAATGGAALEIDLDGSHVETVALTSSPRDSRVYDVYPITLSFEAGPRRLRFHFSGGGAVYIRSVTVTGPAASSGPVDPDAQSACVDAFVANFAPRAWRRPLHTEEERDVATHFRAGIDGGLFFDGLRMALELLLMSPEFLYHVELGVPAGRPGFYRLTADEVAARLSYAAWETMPDAELAAAAGSGALDTEDGIRQQAERLFSDPRARETIRTFYSQWLRLYELDTLTKDTTLFPEFTSAVAAAMREETETFLDAMIWDRNATFAEVLGAQQTYLPPDLAPLYGVPRPTSTTEVDLPAERMGLLTQPSLLALNSRPNRQSSVLRGVFVMHDVLCEPPSQPPVGVDFSGPDNSTAATWRERLLEHTGSEGCQSCHREFESIGFLLEGFDSIGRHRTEEFGSPIDDTGGVVTLGQQPDELEGPVALAQTLAESEVPSWCFARQWFRFAMGRTESAADEPTIAALYEALRTGGIREMLVRLVTTEAFLHRIVEEEVEP